MREQKVHLFRGAPCVRNWSKYQKTVTGWTLCGRRRYRSREDGNIVLPPTTEDPARVTCDYCQCLMPAGREIKPLPLPDPGEVGEPE